MFTSYSLSVCDSFMAQEAFVVRPEGLFQAQLLHFRRESGGLDRNFTQVPHSHQIVGRTSKSEHPVHLENSTMPDFPQQRNRLQPAETFFDAFPLDLADAITFVLSGALIDCASAPPLAVLRYMRRDSQVPALGHKVECVIALVPTCGDPLRSRKVSSITSAASRSAVPLA